MRTLLVANWRYAHKNLSITPINDLKDVSNLLPTNYYGMENEFTDIESDAQFDVIVQNYVEAFNKTTLEEIGSFEHIVFKQD